MSCISALKSVFAIRSPGSQRYNHHLLTVPVIDMKRTEQYIYIKKTPAEHDIVKRRSYYHMRNFCNLIGLDQ